ncbi:carbonic anhydrase [Halomicrobium zhouii]|uniref:carbonic anhydrase n=1 Tax=Halomicrobium zhouii TaxID=767519 RepID=A0A1I6LUN8_9EURY|nr:carbonic anhydrase [Halomicrobium zhouii]SFS07159.1 carbonic anhydrase [Halomicrobium zhouii]
MRRSFVDILERNADHAEAFQFSFDDLQEDQHPEVVSVSCSDSRVLHDHVWGNDEPGHVFTCSNIGNRVTQRGASGDVVSGDVLYPVEHTGTETVVVMGHTGCGAVTATYDALSHGLSDLPGIEYCLELLKPHVEPGVEALPDGLDRSAAVNHLVEYNVDQQVSVLRDCDEIGDTVDVIGVVYDFQGVYGGRRGEVHVINVDGERSVEALREAYPQIDSRIDRLWTY